MIKKILPFFILLLLAAQTSNAASVPLPRGYIPQKCSFDLDDDFVYGERDDDCRICDGNQSTGAYTADPDGDGTPEDFYYVDCNSGTNSGTCGAPNNPCRTIKYAMDNRLDGEGDGAEDIICVRATCNSTNGSATSHVLMKHSGVGLGTSTCSPGAGCTWFKEKTASGNEGTDYRYPKNPLMIIGWDTDQDGCYPPFDDGSAEAVAAGCGSAQPEPAVFDGCASSGCVTGVPSLRVLFHAWENSSTYQKRFWEMAHFTVKNYGRWPGKVCHNDMSVTCNTANASTVCAGLGSCVRPYSGFIHCGGNGTNNPDGACYASGVFGNRYGLYFHDIEQYKMNTPYQYEAGEVDQQSSNQATWRFFHAATDYLAMENIKLDGWSSWAFRGGSSGNHFRVKNWTLRTQEPILTSSGAIESAPSFRFWDNNNATISEILDTYWDVNYNYAGTFSGVPACWSMHMGGRKVFKNNEMRNCGNSLDLVCAGRYPNYTDTCTAEVEGNIFWNDKYESSWRTPHMMQIANPWGPAGVERGQRCLDTNPDHCENNTAVSCTYPDHRPCYGEEWGETGSSVSTASMNCDQGNPAGAIYGEGWKSVDIINNAFICANALCPFRSFIAIMHGSNCNNVTLGPVRIKNNLFHGNLRYDTTDTDGFGAIRVGNVWQKQDYDFLYWGQDYDISNNVFVGLQNDVIYSFQFTGLDKFPPASGILTPTNLVATNNAYLGVISPKFRWGAELNTFSSYTSWASTSGEVNMITSCSNPNGVPKFESDGYHITYDSCLRNIASNTKCPSNDIDGQTRPKNSTDPCDLGPDEWFTNTEPDPDPEPVQVPTYGPRGYQPRKCGFDMNDNDIIGESADCQVCNGGPSADVDGDGVIEDETYVDCNAGTDATSGRGTWDKPFRTLSAAIQYRANRGTANNKEDIICIKGTCAAYNNSREQSATLFFTTSESGVTGQGPGASTNPNATGYDYNVRPKTGVERKDGRYPADPFMIIGWDADGDGCYPPFDDGSGKDGCSVTADVAVLDGCSSSNESNCLQTPGPLYCWEGGDEIRAPCTVNADCPGDYCVNDNRLFNFINNDRFEIAHLTITNYNRGLTEPYNSRYQESVFSFGNGTNPAIEYAYIHDIILDTVHANSDSSTDAAIVAYRVTNGNGGLLYHSFENVLFSHTGTWPMRGWMGEATAHKVMNNTYIFPVVAEGSAESNVKSVLPFKVWYSNADDWLSNVFDYTEAYHFVCSNNTSYNCKTHAACGTGGQCVQQKHPNLYASSIVAHALYLSIRHEDTLIKNNLFKQTKNSIGANLRDDGESGVPSYTIGPYTIDGNIIYHGPGDTGPNSYASIIGFEASSVNGLERSVCSALDDASHTRCSGGWCQESVNGDGNWVTIYKEGSSTDRHSCSVDSDCYGCTPSAEQNCNGTNTYGNADCACEGGEQIFAGALIQNNIVINNGNTKLIDFITVDIGDNCHSKQPGEVGDVVIRNNTIIGYGPSSGSDPVSVFNFGMRFNGKGDWDWKYQEGKIKVYNNLVKATRDFQAINNRKVGADGFPPLDNDKTWSGDDFESDYNIWAGGTPRFNFGDSKDISLATWRSATGEEANSKTATPSLSTEDLWHLDKNDTVAKNAGDPVRACPETDFEGDLRSDGQCDIGADEYVVQAPPSGYQEDTTLFPNPEIGFQLNSSSWTGDFDWFQDTTPDAAFQAHKNRGYRVVLERSRYPGYDTRFTSQDLIDFDRNLKALATYGLKANFRFDYGGATSLDEPTDDTIKSHILQLGGVLTDNKHLIAVMQPGLIGAFGEWHDSVTYATDFPAGGAFNPYKAGGCGVLNTLLNDFWFATWPSDRLLGIRLPLAYQCPVFGVTSPQQGVYNQFVTSTNAFTTEPIARAAPMDDGIFKGAGGTFKCGERTQQWEFWDKQTDYTGYWGEPDGLSPYCEPLDCGISTVGYYATDTCTTDADCDQGEVCRNDLQDCDKVMEWAETMNLIMFNERADGAGKETMDRLKTTYCTYRGVNRSAYDHMKAFMGYRLVLTEATWPTSAKGNTSISFHFKIKNRGWGRVYNKRPVFLSLINNNIRRDIELTNVDPRWWMPNDAISSVTVEAVIPGDTPTGVYSVNLWLPDEERTLRYNTDYSIRLANLNMWQSSSGMNKLGTITITQADTVTPPDKQGYTARPCGFDMDNDGLVGEYTDDCRVCDGQTTNPDEDSTLEDMVYIDCDTGSDTATCGLPTSPCKSITYAMTTRANPGNGREDIYCFTGTCKTDTDLEFAGWGVGSRKACEGSSYETGGPNWGKDCDTNTDCPGDAQRGIVGSCGTGTNNWGVKRALEGTDAKWQFKYPKNPAMLIGWDKDKDRQYPPFDQDDVSILDGTPRCSNNVNTTCTVDSDCGTGNTCVERCFAINLASTRDWFEIAHFTARNFGQGCTQGGFFSTKTTNAGVRTGIYLHDLELYGINKGASYGPNRHVFNNDEYPSTTEYLAYDNILVKDFGGGMARGNMGGGELNWERPLGGPVKFEHVQFENARPASCTGVGGIKYWGVGHFEAISNLIRPNILSTAPPSDMQGFILSGCINGAWIVNNKIEDTQNAIRILNATATECTVYPQKDIGFIRNIYESDWSFHADGTQCGDGTELGKTPVMVYGVHPTCLDCDISSCVPGSTQYSNCENLYNNPNTSTRDWVECIYDSRPGNIDIHSNAFIVDDYYACAVLSAGTNCANYASKNGYISFIHNTCRGRLLTDYSVSLRLGSLYSDVAANAFSNLINDFVILNNTWSGIFAGDASTRKKSFLFDTVNNIAAGPTWSYRFDGNNWDPDAVGTGSFVFESISHNNISAAMTAGIHGPDSQACLASTQPDWYHLNETDQCLQDQGVPQGYYFFDIDKQSRYLVTPDIGADEVVYGTTTSTSTTTVTDTTATTTTTDTTSTSEGASTTTTTTTLGPCVWTSILTRTPTGADSDGATRNWRMVIPAESTPVYANKIRFKLQASSSPAFIQGMSIGKTTLDGGGKNNPPQKDSYLETPTRVTFNGGSSVAVIGINEYLWSDEIDYAFDKSIDNSIHIFTTARNFVFGGDGEKFNDSSSNDYTMTLNPPLSAGIGWNAVTEIEVCEATTGFITLSPVSLEVFEYDNVLEIPIYRLGGSENPVSIKFDTLDTLGTATGGISCTAGVDYIVQRNLSISWASGDLGVKTVPIFICPDTEKDVLETIKVQISNPLGAPLGVNSTQTIYVLDDDSTYLNVHPTVYKTCDATNTSSVTLNNVSVPNLPYMVTLIFVGAKSTPTLSPIGDCDLDTATVTYGVTQAAKAITSKIVSGDKETCNGIFYITNPPIGTNRVIVTWPTTTTVLDKQVVVRTIYNANQTGPDIFVQQARDTAGNTQDSVIQLLSQYQSSLGVDILTLGNIPSTISPKETDQVTIALTDSSPACDASGSYSAVSMFRDKLPSTFKMGWEWLTINSYSNLTHSAAVWSANNNLTTTTTTTLVSTTTTTTTTTVPTAYDVQLYNPITINVEHISQTYTEVQASPNPYLDRRLQCIFQHRASGYIYKIEGVYNTNKAGSSSGSWFKCNFTPTKTGIWDWAIKFCAGPEAAISSAAPCIGFTDLSAQILPNAGFFRVGNSNKSGKDFRQMSKGPISNPYAISVNSGRGGFYFKHEGGDHFVPIGLGVGEGFLGYVGFDNTKAIRTNLNYGVEPKTFEDHISDWQAGDPDWICGATDFRLPQTLGTCLCANDSTCQRTQAGRGIIGAINYLSSKGVNMQYMITHNTNTSLAGGDTSDVYIYVNGTAGTEENRKHVDVSKMNQWNTLFEHMQKKGVGMYFQLADTEVDNVWGVGTSGQLFTACTNSSDFTQCLSPTWKLYARELIGRFGHHPVLIYDLGEENDFTNPTRAAMLAYIKDIDAYDHPIVIHTYNTTASIESIYKNTVNGVALHHDMYNRQVWDYFLDGTSFQTSLTDQNLYNLIKTYKDQSQSDGVYWATMITTPRSCNADSATDLQGCRENRFYPTLFGGGGGFLWYLTNNKRCTGAPGNACSSDAGCTAGICSSDMLDSTLNSYLSLESNVLKWSGIGNQVLNESQLNLNEMSPFLDTPCDSSSSELTYNLYNPDGAIVAYNEDGGTFTCDLSQYSAETLFNAMWTDGVNGDSCLDLTDIPGGSASTNIGTCSCCESGHYILQLIGESVVTTTTTTSSTTTTTTTTTTLDPTKRGIKIHGAEIDGSKL